MTEAPSTSLAEGEAAPDFELLDQHGQPFRLSAHRGASNVVLVFYPWAFTSVCTTELHDLRDAWPLFVSHRVEVAAISCDSRFAVRSFADSGGIEFPMLSDFWPHGQVAAAYGVLDTDLGCARRSSFIIDKNGRVAWAVHNAMPDARNLREYAEVLDRLG